MVKKLFKHEFLAWLRIMPVIYGIQLVVAAINRGIQLFESDSVYYSIISASAMVMYVVILMVGIAAPQVFGVTRFYKNLFSGEGYLSFTLPVTTDAHLWVKVLTAVCFSVVSALVAALSAVIITSGELLSEICKAFTYLVGTIPQEIAVHLVFYALELVLMLLVAEMGGYLLYYTCICIGQLFRKNRILAAVGVYFGIYVITQILSTVMSVIFIVLEASGQMEKIYTLIFENIFVTGHIMLCGVLVLSGVMALVSYLVCRTIIRKKLNLE